MKSLNSFATIRVIVVEDNRIFRETLASMINTQPDIDVLAAVGCEGVLRRVRDMAPDVVLVDQAVRGQHNFQLAELVGEAAAGVKLIVMNMEPIEPDLVHFVQTGVSGFLLKEATLEDFLNAIRLVVNGTNVLPQALARSLFSAIADPNGRAGAWPSPQARLTRREQEIVELIADGLSNKEIAQRLNLATFTIKTHVHNIFEKLALHTRAQVASCYARARPSAPLASSRPRELAHFSFAWPMVQSTHGR